MSDKCQAQGCKKYRPAKMTDSDARAIGWMVWEGSTLGGSVSAVRFCPTHAGRTEEEAEAQEVGFDAHCFTCGEDATDDSDFEGTREAAEGWMEEHVCESDVSIREPKKVGA